MKRMGTIIFTLGFATLFFTACGGDQTKADQIDASDIPKWAMTPPAACGVGIAEHRGNLGIAQQTAVARGRDMLARQLQTKIEGMIKDYQQAGETDDKDFTEELTTQVSRQIVELRLRYPPSCSRSQVSRSSTTHLFVYSLRLSGAFDRMNTLSQKLVSPRERAKMSSRTSMSN